MLDPARLGPTYWRSARARCYRVVQTVKIEILLKMIENDDPVGTYLCRALPKDFPPKTTVYDYLELWNRDGTLALIHHALYVRSREHAGREANPTVAIIDSQSVKGAEYGGLH